MAPLPSSIRTATPCREPAHLRIDGIDAPDATDTRLPTRRTSRVATTAEQTGDAPSCSRSRADVSGCGSRRTAEHGPRRRRLALRLGRLAETGEQAARLPSRRLGVADLLVGIAVGVASAAGQRRDHQGLPVSRRREHAAVWTGFCAARPSSSGFPSRSSPAGFSAPAITPPTDEPTQIPAPAYPNPSNRPP